MEIYIYIYIYNGLISALKMPYAPQNFCTHSLEHISLFIYLLTYFLGIIFVNLVINLHICLFLKSLLLLAMKV